MPLTCLRHQQASSVMTEPCQRCDTPDEELGLVRDDGAAAGLSAAPTTGANPQRDVNPETARWLIKHPSGNTD
jgi:hypothetical protein